MKWYYESGGEQQGPVDEAALRVMLSDGTLTAGNKVWHKDLPGWTPAAEVLDLAEEAPEPPPTDDATEPTEAAMDSDEAADDEPVMDDASTSAPEEADAIAKAKDAAGKMFGAMKGLLDEDEAESPEANDGADEFADIEWTEKDERQLMHRVRARMQSEDRGGPKLLPSFGGESAANIRRRAELHAQIKRQMLAGKVVAKAVAALRDTPMPAAAADVKQDFGDCAAKLSHWWQGGNTAISKAAHKRMKKLVTHWKQNLTAEADHGEVLAGFEADLAAIRERTLKSLKLVAIGLAVGAVALLIML